MRAVGHKAETFHMLLQFVKGLSLGKEVAWEK
jgi:hypothetical protein